MTFNDAVAGWLLLARDRYVASVESVVTEGSDWAGDTEGGFYGTAETTVVYTDTNGERHSVNLDGADLASLWNHVTSALTPRLSGARKDPM
jgi:hypothetical protein